MMLGRNIFGRGLIYAAVAGMLLGSFPVAAEALEKPQFQEATEETQERMEELYAKNSAKGILQGLKSLMVREVYYKDGKSIGKGYIYGDPENFMYELSSGESLLATPTLYLTMYNGDMQEYLFKPDEYESTFQNLYKNFGMEMGKGEKAVEFAEDEDYVYMVTETADEEDVKNWLRSANAFQEDAYSYEEGQVIRDTMTFDRDKERLLFEETYLVGKDGTKELLHRSDLVFNEVKDVNKSSFAKYFSGEQRNFVIVTNPGTDKEESWGYTVPRGVAFDICFDGEYPDVYTDEECTQPFKFSNSDQQNDCYLYVPGSVSGANNEGDGMGM